MTSSPLDYLYMDIVKVFPAEIWARRRPYRPVKKTKPEVSIGRRLRDYRRAAGLTQKNLAMKLQLKVGSLRAIELDREVPAETVLEAINNILAKPYDADSD